MVENRKMGKRRRRKGTGEAGPNDVAVTDLMAICISIRYALACVCMTMSCVRAVSTAILLQRRVRQPTDGSTADGTLGSGGQVRTHSPIRPMPAPPMPTAPACPPRGPGASSTSLPTAVVMSSGCLLVSTLWVPTAGFHCLCPRTALTGVPIPLCPAPPSVCADGRCGSSCPNP